jgi:Mycothiol maleylpyruvate isomerase N-terminal domain
MREPQMKSPSPILVANLFPELRGLLLSLLGDLTAEDWLRPTAAGEWNVKDIAAHLLGGDIGSLSRRRDGHVLSGSISAWDAKLEFSTSNAANVLKNEGACPVPTPLFRSTTIRQGIKPSGAAAAGLGMRVPTVQQGHAGRHQRSQASLQSARRLTLPALVLLSLHQSRLTISRFARRRSAEESCRQGIWARRCGLKKSSLRNASASFSP